MDILFLTALSLIALCFAALNASAEPNQSLSSSQTEHVSPLACNAFALSPDTRKRHFEELGPALLKLKKSIRELPDGYELELPADNKTYQLLTEWAFQERLCCPFFDIDCAWTEKTDRYGYVLPAGQGLRNSLSWSWTSPSLIRTHPINRAAVATA